MIESNYKCEYHDLIELIKIYKSYKNLLEKFIKHHPEYTYEIKLTPGDLDHKLEIFIKQCYE